MAGCVVGISPSGRISSRLRQPLPAPASEAEIRKIALSVRMIGRAPLQASWCALCLEDDREIGCVWGASSGEALVRVARASGNRGPRPKGESRSIRAGSASRGVDWTKWIAKVLGWRDALYSHTGVPQRMRPSPGEQVGQRTQALEEAPLAPLDPVQVAVSGVVGRTAADSSAGSRPRACGICWK